VPFAVSTTMIGPAPGVGLTGAGAFFAAVCAETTALQSSAALIRDQISQLGIG
jgi:hypothetical protein